jgi:tetratricopeptide (TPR) repeat protein
VASWKPFPYAGEFKFTVATVRKSWAVLHAGDREPRPTDDRVLQAWAYFHAGEFEKAVQAGRALGKSGVIVSSQALCMYARHLESDESQRQSLLLEVADLTAHFASHSPGVANAWYWQAYALGQYSQDISVAKALAQGLGTRVREALERTIELEPEHADAHVALGAFHAEVINKVGVLIGSMTYGAKKDVGLALYQRALTLHSGSANAMVEYGNALLMMDGERRLDEARSWYHKAVRCTPLDATQRLDHDVARAELAEAR